MFSDTIDLSHLKIPGDVSISSEVVKLEEKAEKVHQPEAKKPVAKRRAPRKRLVQANEKTEQKEDAQSIEPTVAGAETTSTPAPSAPTEPTAESTA